MNTYFKKDTIRKIVETFCYFTTPDATHNSENLLYFHIEQYLRKRLSKKVKLEMLDLFSDFSNILKTNADLYLYSNNNKSYYDCLNQLKKELSAEDKLDLYLEILDYCIDNRDLLNKSKNLVNEKLKLLEEYFCLDSNEIKAIYHFLTNNLDRSIIIKNMIIIGNFDHLNITSFKKINRPDIKGKIYALYIKSKNTFLFKYEGTQQLFINNKIIIPKQFYQISTGGTIKGQFIKPLYFNEINSHFTNNSNSYELVADNISFRFNKSNFGVKKLSFSVASGELMAIMGGSGAGKTTLLNLLSGITKPDTGNVFINGLNLNNNLKHLKKHIGYVPQTDLLIEELTVYQNLLFNTELCRSDLSKSEIINLTIKTLSDLGLEHIKHLKVGSPLEKKISGGQRKRLNIALEVIRNPGIIFLDEPTSGLSSSDSLSVIKLLKKFSSDGNIVIINIHQPSSDIYYHFDKLLLLDEFGYTAYFGNPFNAFEYFKKHLDFVDSVIDDSLDFGQITPEKLTDLLEYKHISDKGKFNTKRIFDGASWHKKFLETCPSEYDIKIKPLKNTITQIPSSWQQLMLFFKRSVISKLSDIQYLIPLTLGAPILSLFMSFFLKYTDPSTHEYSFMQNENIPAFIFISVIVSMFLGLIISAGEIHKDLKIIKRESFLDLSSWAYLNSKVLYILIVNLFQVLLFTYIGCYILEIKGIFWKFAFILWLTSNTSSMIGLFISIKFKTILSIYISIPFILIPQILLAGAIVDFNKLHHSITSYQYVPVYGDLNISRWAYESIVTIQHTQNPYNKIIIDDLIEQSELIYYINFVIPKLETQYSIYTKEKNSNLKEELQNLLKDITNSFPQININPNSISNPKLFIHNIKILKQFLKSLLSNNYDRINNKKLENQHIPKDQYLNQQLSDMVLKSRDYKKYFYIDGKIYRKYQPGYYICDNKWGRSHYFAPYKIIGNYKVETWIINSIVIILWGAFAYLLTFSLLRKRKKQYN